MEKKRQIIAMGGASAISLANTKRRENPTLTPIECLSTLQEIDYQLEKYILAQTKKTSPRVCFMATASGDDPGIYAVFYEVMKKFDCIPTHLSLFSGTSPDLRSQLLNQDLILVHGGNTRNMLTLWKDWGVDHLLREAYDQGTVLAGWSAGSICWFEAGVTDSVPGTLSALKALGFLKGSNCPHYDGEPERRPNYQRLMKEGKLQAGYAADDGVALHFTSNPGENDFSLESIVSSRPEARAYRVSCEAGQVSEKMLVPRYLG